MVKGIWNCIILLQSDRCETVEGNYYFPPDIVNRKYFKGKHSAISCQLASSGGTALTAIRLSHIGQCLN
ncbi:MAG: DUF427 domain-containing protein [Okeania sp. SIO3B5]|uniref:DUF427 domain-containing protein n=1 Tax=Okeania sp. SIO3B5 TaxID=2607811 RepID=UPI0014010169|nr:DUF427 domain-containing protein [Okeania sp. SIO3B5]NEO53222.1 DUF427 domain-containing protein [Okeania sp. SIO3B5]